MPSLRHITKPARVQRPSLEELLRTIEDRAAFLACAPNALATTPDDALNPRALSGLADMCSDVQRLACEARNEFLRRRDE